MSDPAPIPSWRSILLLLAINIILLALLAWFISPIWAFYSGSILYSKPGLGPVIEYTPHPPPTYQQTQIAKGCGDPQAICVADMLPVATSIFESTSPWLWIIAILLIGIGIALGAIEDRRAKK